jgi:hypothetical protein
VPVPRIPAITTAYGHDGGVARCGARTQLEASAAVLRGCAPSPGSNRPRGLPGSTLRLVLLVTAAFVALALQPVAARRAGIRQGDLDGDGVSDAYVTVRCSD